MKLLTKLTVIAATFAVIGSNAAFADNQQLQNLLALQRQAAERNQKTTTIAVYGNHRGIGRSGTMREQRTESRFELRSNAHGQTFGTYVPVK